MELVFSIPMDKKLEDTLKSKGKYALSTILDDLTFMCNHIRDDLFTDCPLAVKCPFINKKDCEEITKDDWKPYVSFKK